MSFYELLTIREGDLEMREEGSRFTLRAGHSLLLLPGRRHEPLAGYGENLVFYWAYFSAEAPLLDQIPQHTIAPLADRMLDLWHRLIDDRDTFGSESDACVLSLARLLHELGSPGERSPTGGASAILAKRAQVLIRSRLGEELSTSLIADELACCPDYLGRVYKQCFGMTVVEAIQRMRIERARVLLLSAEQSIEHIARDCGFLDSGYFRRIFKRQVGLSPTTFRSMHVHVDLNAS